MEPIAIVGMSCRFPGAPHSAALWELLHHGVNAIEEVPRDRWDVNEYYAPKTQPGKMCTRWGGFLERVDEFDAAFFGISTREASFMDPQQRVVLEVTWEALEEAGIAPTSLAGTRTGVFIGVSNYDYNRLICRDHVTMDAYSSTGTILAITANRISYLLNLRGPSVAVDTACSSSLVSVHLACQSLRAGECYSALAGGVNLILSPEVTIILSQGGLMSPDGSCKAFDEAANGYVRSEGCGVVVLKRLSDAERDRNNILALILGSAVNQDGRTNGLTAPSAAAQQDVIRQAFAAADIRPDELSYVEAHGSGTPLGDIIETRALRSVLLKGRSADGMCAIGSIKTNIGHAESAAGIAGLMKVVLALQHEMIPPNLHLNKLNPHIRFQDSPLFIPTEAHQWPSGSSRRLAGVSSFGIGGTNAHVVVQEAGSRTISPTAPGRTLKFLPLSAKTENSLRQLVQSYRSFLEERPEVSPANLCFTASQGRSHFDHRLTVDGETIEQLSEQLTTLSEKDAGKENGEQPVVHQPKRLIAFLCTGRGEDYVGLGRELYESELVFREIFHRCDEFSREELQLPLVSLLDSEAAARSLDSKHAALLVFAFQYALAEVWRSWGLAAAAVKGFGLGEVAAACVEGTLPIEEGLKTVVNVAGAPRTEDVRLNSDRLAAEFQSLNDRGINVFLELGPRSDVAESGMRSLPTGSYLWLASLCRESVCDELSERLKEMYRYGVDIDWSTHFRNSPHALISLPTYPFDRKRFWFT
jgi:acyl transferase domain-containing protein